MAKTLSAPKTLPAAAPATDAARPEPAQEQLFHDTLQQLWQQAERDIEAERERERQLALQRARFNLD
ncbi:MAG: hypothetical protein NZM28_09020 [Fimbriimonadales bacterium]|nr:hypothetical protein [Fimbriimonadales bacterium]